MKRLLLLPLLLPALLSLLACSDAVYGTCADDTVCAGGTVCAFGFCVEANQLDTVDVEIEPADPNLPVQTVFDVDASIADGRVEVELREAESLSGTVRNAAGSAQPALVQVVPEKSIAGRLRVSSSDTAVDGSFDLRVLDDSNVDYRLRVTPESDLYPPLEVAPVSPGPLDDPLVVDAEGVSSFARLHGFVVAGEGVEAQPISDLRVQVIAGGRRLSTVAVTGRDGAFDVSLREIPTGAVLDVDPVAENGGVPSLEVPLDVVGGDIDLGTLSLGAISAPVSVSGVVTRGGGAVRGAVVAFHGLVGAGTYRGSVVADASGSFSVPLIPGEYTLAAVPVAGGRASLVVVPLTVTTARDDVALVLPSRVDVDLDIVTQDGTPVTAASVSFERVGDATVGLAEPALLGAQPVFVTSSDDSGRASAAVDRGRYRVGIQPPRGSGAPAFSLLMTVDGEDRLAITLPPQRVLAGVVTSGGAAAPGAFVRVFSRIVDEQGRAVFLGEAVAEADGSFAVPVPDLAVR